MQSLKISQVKQREQRRATKRYTEHTVGQRQESNIEKSSTICSYYMKENRELHIYEYICHTRTLVHSHNKITKAHTLHEYNT